MIHTYPRRLWYVYNYLLPSMLRQGIKGEDIRIYNDSALEGNLRACMNAFGSVGNDDGGTWHLQDDVIISHDFKERTEALDEGIVCGFSSLKYDGDIKENIGEVSRAQMWFSFPCIRIPNKMARECSEWVTKYIIGNPVYFDYWKNGVNDDWAFKLYVKEFHADCKVLNLAPNLVDHIDYLIGGGSGKKPRMHPVRSQYWQDDYLVEELSHALVHD